MNKLLKCCFKLFFTGLALMTISLSTNKTVVAEETLQNVQTFVNHTDGQWIQDATGWWYRYPDGSYPKNKWEQINGKYYYFNAQGYIIAGWQQLTGFGKHKEFAWYYFDPVNGDMKTGWQAINGKWYYLDPVEGYMYTGVQRLSDRKTYYLDPVNGDMKTGWQRLPWKYANGEVAYCWYYFAPEDGHRVEGWRKIDNKWYHFTTGAGVMSSGGWDGEYYLKDNGEMAHDETLLIRGYYYTFDSNGHVTKVVKA